MKKTKLIIFAVAFVALLVVAAAVFPKISKNYSTDVQSTAVTNTKAAADFTVYSTNGQAVKLSDFYGKPTVVNFWATWCGYCVQELPDFNTLYAQYGEQVNFAMVDLCDGYRETQSSALQFVSEQGYAFPIYFDTDYSASQAYSISGIPMTLFIDKDGNLFKVHNGLITEDELKQYIEAMIGEAQ